MAEIDKISFVCPFAAHENIIFIEGDTGTKLVVCEPAGLTQFQTNHFISRYNY